MSDDVKKIAGAESPAMTPLDQASAILKAADEATPGDWQSQHQNDLDGQLTIIGNVDGPDDGRFTFTNICDVDEAPDECFANARLIILARNTAPAIALALIEKHRALEEALELFRSICSAYENQDLNHVDFRVKCAEFARDFVARQGATAPAASVSNQIAGMKEKSE